MPGAGSIAPSIAPTSLAAAAGCNGSAAFAGNGSDAVFTGWNAGLGTGSWTVALWLDTTAIPLNSPPHYLFSCWNNGFRCFINGAAGGGNAMLRGSFAEVAAFGAASGSSPTHLAWKHDAVAGTITSYVNGVLNHVVNNPSVFVPPATSGTGFVLGGNDHTFSGLSVAPVGMFIDDFRLYSTAISDAEIAMIAGHCGLGPCALPTESLTTLFHESFDDNSAGWTLGTEWQIGSATASPPHSWLPGNGDPGIDADGVPGGGVAGAVIGGNVSVAVHTTPYWLTSPTIDTTGISAPTLEFSRWLNSDYAPYMTNHIEVWDGVMWNTLWQSGGPPEVYDSAWTLQTYDLSPYSNAELQIRFGHAIGWAGAASHMSGWNLDNVKIYGDLMPSGPLFDIRAETIGPDYEITFRNRACSP